MKLGMPVLVECPTLEENTALAEKMGLSFVEVNQSFPQYLTDRLSAEKMKEEAMRHNLFYTFHAGEDCNPFSFDDTIADAYTESLKKTVALALEVGAARINMHLLRGIYVTLPEKRIFLNEVYQDAFLENAMRFGKEMQAAIGTMPLKLCIENTDGFLPFELNALEQLLLHYSCFGITLDVGHNACVDYRDDEFLRRFSGRLCHMHLHDAKNKNPHLAFGDGDIDLKKYLDLGDYHQCTGVIEVKTVEGLQKSINYLKK